MNIIRCNQPTRPYRMSCTLIEAGLLFYITACDLTSVISVNPYIRRVYVSISNFETVRKNLMLPGHLITAPRLLTDGL